MLFHNVYLIEWAYGYARSNCKRRGRKGTKEEQGRKGNIGERRDDDKEGNGARKREKEGKDENSENVYCSLTEQGIYSRDLAPADCFVSYSANQETE